MLNNTRIAIEKSVFDEIASARSWQWNTGIFRQREQRCDEARLNGGSAGD
jgi:hypothetical protein